MLHYRGSLLGGTVGDALGAPLAFIDRDNAFDLGAQASALTRGYPTGYLSAGFLALVIAEIFAGKSLRDAIRAAKLTLITQPDHEEVLKAVENAEGLASSDHGSIAELGTGWVAEQALAIGLYCSLVAPSFEEAVVLAVNHSGDSDSTGAITGNICGALYGVDSSPARWLDQLELRQEVETIANDRAAVRDELSIWRAI